jgi:hypothetical protein
MFPSRMESAFVSEQELSADVLSSFLRGVEV